MKTGTLESIQTNCDRLTKEQILSDDFIESLFMIEDEGQRDALIVKVGQRAKDVGCKTDFTKLVKAFEKQIKSFRTELVSAVQTVPEGNVFSFKPIGADNTTTFNTGEWNVSDDGVITCKGKRIIRASHYPVIISKRMTNIESGTVKLEVTWWLNEKRKSYTADRGTFASKQKIILLADYDFPVSSESASPMIAYLADFEAMNLDLIPSELSSSRFGWSGDEFVPFTDQVIFDGGIPSKSLVNAVVEHGEYDAWLETVGQIRKSGRNEPLVYLAASFGSVLLPLLGIQSFVTNLYGTTGKGKTVALMLAASVWANPANDGGYLTESTGTVNALEQKQGILNNLPLMVDDMSKVKKENKRQTISDMIYRLCAGNGRDRLTRTIQLRQTATWNNIILTNMERPLVDDEMQGGAINRVLDFEIEDGAIFQNGNAVVTALVENYGHAGKRFIDAVKAIDIDGIKKLVSQYQERIRQTAADQGDVKEEKQIIPLAILLTADEIAEHSIFHDGVRLNIDYCVRMLKSTNQVSEEERAYRYLMDTILQHKDRFYRNDDDYDYGECWGMHYNEFYIAIIPKCLSDIFSEPNFSKKTFIEWADRKGLLVSDNDSNHQHQKRLTIGKGIRSVRPWMYVIRTDYEPKRTASENDSDLFIIHGDADPQPDEPLPFEMPS